MSITLFIVKVKVRMDRGQSHVDFFKGMVYVMIAFRLFLDAVEKYGYSVKEYTFVYFIIPLVYPIFIYTLGYLDELYGFWKAQAVYCSETLNPWNVKLMSKLDEVINLLKR